MDSGTAGITAAYYCANTCNYTGAVPATIRSDAENAAFYIAWHTANGAATSPWLGMFYDTTSTNWYYGTDDNHVSNVEAQYLPWTDDYSSDTSTGRYCAYAYHLPGNITAHFSALDCPELNPAACEVGRT